MRENKNYYKKKIILFLFILTIIFAILSLHGYYHTKISDPIQLWSAVLYGTVKLFLFAAPLSAENPGGIFYELAKWLAPILTSAFIFTQISNVLLHLKNMFLNGISRKHVILFGDSPVARALLTNLLANRESYRISFVTKQFLEEQRKNKLERKGIASYQLDFEKCDQNEIRDLFLALHISSAKYLFFTGESDLENFSLYASVIGRIRPKKNIVSFVHCESNTVIGYMEDLRPEGMDTVYFEEEELTVRMLLEKKAVQERLFSSFSRLPFADSGKEQSNLGQKQADLGKEPTVEEIDATILPPHVLVFGINSLLFPLLKKLANDATLSLQKNARVTVVDTDAGKKLHELFPVQGKEGIFRALEMDSIELCSEHSSYRKREQIRAYLKSMEQEERPSLFFLLQEDVIENLKVLQLLRSSFQEAPKLFRNSSAVVLSHVLKEEGEKVETFGDLSTVLTEPVLIRASLDNRAKAFNEAYNKAAEAAGMGKGSGWNTLSYVRKESSRLSASHASVKEAFLRQFFRDRSDAEIRAILSRKEAEFRSLEELEKKDKPAFRERFRHFLKENPELDFLSRLEHKRWCNSYYAMFFRYGEKKDESRKTHPCLIDEWETVIGEKFDLCHPEYDLLSVFALFKEV